MKIKLSALILALLMGSQAYTMDMGNDNTQSVTIKYIDLITEYERSCIALEDWMVAVLGSLPTEDNVKRLQQRYEELISLRGVLLNALAKTMDSLSASRLEGKTLEHLLAGCSNHYRRSYELSFDEIRNRIEVLKKEAQANEELKLKEIFERRKAEQKAKENMEAQDKQGEAARPEAEKSANAEAQRKEAEIKFKREELRRKMRAEQEVLRQWCAQAVKEKNEREAREKSQKNASDSNDPSTQP